MKIGSVSSYALIENSDIVHNYRRISKNRKDYEKSCENYREGMDTSPFLFHGVEMTAALCGVDLSGILPVQRPADLAGLCEF